MSRGKVLEVLRALGCTVRLQLHELLPSEVMHDQGCQLN